MCLAVPGRLLDRTEDRGTPMGTIETDGVTREVCLLCVPEATPGDHVLVHAGFAIALVDADAARATLAAFADLDEAEGSAP